MTPELQTYFFNNPDPLINFVTNSLKANPKGFVLFEAENYDFEVDLEAINLNTRDFYVEHIMDLTKISLILAKSSWGFYAKKMQVRDNKLVWQTTDKWQNIRGAYVRVRSVDENVDLTLKKDGRIQARYRDMFQNFVIEQQGNKTNIVFGYYRWTCDYQDGRFYVHDVLKETTAKMILSVAMMFLLHKAVADMNFGWKECRTESKTA